MLDSHPPFQIDGNFGSAAAITEALVQSQKDKIFILPALPDEWKNGWVKRDWSRGGLKADIKWKDGKLTNFLVKAERSGSKTFYWNGREIEIYLKEQEPVDVAAKLLHS